MSGVSSPESEIQPRPLDTGYIVDLHNYKAPDTTWCEKGDKSGQKFLEQARGRVDLYLQDVNRFTQFKNDNLKTDTTKYEEATTEAAANRQRLKIQGDVSEGDITRKWLVDKIDARVTISELNTNYEEIKNT